MRSLSATLLLLLACTFSHAQVNKKVLLQDIQALTLSRNKMTTGRRSSPVKQMKCVSGDACAASADIQNMQCYNRGFDGRDVQWECKAELEDLYRFGSTDVSCEGYAHKNDPYVLVGSCGVEYTLHYTEKGKRYLKEKSKRSNDYSYGYDDTNDYASDYETRGTSWVAKFIWMVVAGIFLYSVYNTCMQAAARGGNRPAAGPNNTGRNGGGGGGGGFFGGGGAPGFGGGGSGSGNGGSGTNCNDPPMNSQQQQQQGPGFWSGLGLGGLLGSMLNRSQQPRYGYDSGFGGRRYPQGFASGSGMRARPSASFSSSSSSSSSTRTASGYGGTSRR
ncbi:Store-operated calcium entry-associated regulatory factor [Chytriomyces hyalinus]|nr:Store-operated calcium entry-associated regulatory factor [Chytriomyces hyalinus]